MGCNGGWACYKKRIAFLSNWQNYEMPVLQITNQFLQKNYNRMEFYKKLQELKMKGCGPAYFTKVMQFFSEGSCYIMDAHLAKSIMLLWDEPTLIKMNQLKNSVENSNKNDSFVYEEFCIKLERLTELINNKTGQTYNPLEIEERLFSRGGRKPGKWKKYVQEYINEFQ